jgi:hypothetical protein
MVLLYYSKLRVSNYQESLGQGKIITSGNEAAMTISHTPTAFQAQLLQLAYLFIINICKLLILSGNIHLGHYNQPLMI